MPTALRGLSLRRETRVQIRYPYLSRVEDFVLFFPITPASLPGTGGQGTITEADDLDDADTADLFTEVSRGIDKWLWFVEAHSQATE